MIKTLESQLVPSQKLYILSQWMPLSLLHTIPVSSWAGNSPQIKQDCSPLLKSIKDFNQMKQVLSQVITGNVSLNRLSLMKLLDVSVSSSGYSSCALIFSHFKDLLNTDTCNTMIRSYCDSNKHSQAIVIFKLMRGIGETPDSFTFSSVLKSVAQLMYLEIGKAIHGCVIKVGFISDVFTNTALVHMYSSNSSVHLGRQVFDEMPIRNSVTWNAMITGYTHNRKFKEAVNMFHEMQNSVLEPSEVTVVSALTACAHLGALNQGKWIHNYIKKNRIRLNVFVGTALIDMYAKCGIIEESEKVFGALATKNTFTWNALISGFAMNSKGNAALQAFHAMVKENYKPDGVTFLAILCACCHQGLVYDGKKIFNLMQKEFRLRPRIEHYGCMVDLLGRAGLLDEARKLIENMPMKPDSVLWRSLLASCRIYRNASLSKISIKNLLELEPNNGENYVLLSNLYAQEQKWEKIAEVREMMSRKEIQKVPGCSSIEVDNVIHEFVVTGRYEKAGWEDVYKKLEDINIELKLAGYVVDTDMISYDLEEEEKEDSVMQHSEKLALAFGLLRTLPGSVIRIVKNLRICRDCHSFFKFASKVCCRDITVRDRNRFHHFKQGTCSCNDYW